MKTEGVEVEILNAVIDGKITDDLLNATKLIAEMTKFLQTDAGLASLALFNRVNKILQIESKIDDKEQYKTNINKNLLQTEEEASIYENITNIANILKDNLKINDYKSALASLTALNEPMDRFFAQIKVICGDEDIRLNRLKILTLVQNSFNNIARFDKLNMKN